MMRSTGLIRPSRRVRIAALLLCDVVAGCGGRVADASGVMEEQRPSLVLEAVEASGPKAAGEHPVELFHTTDLALVGDTIVLVDSGNDRLVLLDASLSPLAVIGRQGAGPGEFEAPLTIRTAPDRMVVYELGNARFNVFERNGEFRQVIPGITSGGWFEMLSDGRVVVPARSAANYLAFAGDTAHAFAGRVDTARTEQQIRAAMEGFRYPLLAATGDTLHVFDAVAGVLLKYDVRGRLLLKRALPTALLDSLKSELHDTMAPFLKRGAVIGGAGVAKGLTVTRDGRLLLLLSYSRTVALLIDPVTYRATRIIVRDDGPAATSLRVAAAAVYAQPRLYAVTSDSVIAYRLGPATK